MSLNLEEIWLTPKQIAEYCNTSEGNLRAYCRKQKWLGCDLITRREACVFSKHGEWKIRLDSIPEKYQQMIKAHLKPALTTTSPISDSTPKPSAPTLSAPIIEKTVSIHLPMLSESAQRRVDEKLKNGLNHRQRKKFREEGAAALAGKYGEHRKGDTLFNRNPELKEAARAMLVQHPDVKDMVAYKALAAAFKELEFTYFTFRNNYNRLKEEPEFKFIKDPSSSKSSLRPAFGDRDWEIERPSQRWEIDDSPADVICADGKRYFINVIIDVYTRFARFMLIERVNSTMTRAHLRSVLLELGIPEEIVVDNGKNYVDGNFQAACAALGINLTYCLPGRGDQKPFAERAFRTLQHGVLSLAEGFIGHNVQERKRIEDRNKYHLKNLKSSKKTKENQEEPIQTGLSFEELKRWLATATHDYNNSVHSSLKCTPQQALTTALSKGFTPKRVANPQVLDILMQDVLRRGGRLPIISKKGIVYTINGKTRRFVHEDMALYAEKEAHCCYDPVANVITVFVDNTYICTAREWEDLNSEERHAVALKAQQIFDTHNRRAIKAELKKPDPAVALIDSLQENLPTELANEAHNVVKLPHKIKKEDAQQKANDEIAATLAKLAERRNKIA